MKHFGGFGHSKALCDEYLAFPPQSHERPYHRSVVNNASEPAARCHLAESSRERGVSLVDAGIGGLGGLNRQPSPGCQQTRIMTTCRKRHTTPWCVGVSPEPRQSSSEKLGKLE